MYAWRLGWRGTFFGPVPKSDGDAIGVWRMEKWQRLTVGPRREMVNGVWLVFSFSDQELTVFLPASGVESNKQVRVKRFPRL